MGLNIPNIALRGPEYPPSTLTAALNFSSSSRVREAFEAASVLANSEPGWGIKVLPKWAISWPCGQLAGIGRTAQYSQHIKDYERIFTDAFRPLNAQPQGGLKHIIVLDISDLLSPASLKRALCTIFERVRQRRKDTSLTNGTDELYRDLVENHVSKSFSDPTCSHRNAGPSSLRDDREPTAEERERLALMFKGEQASLEKLTGRSFPWAQHPTEG